MFCFGKQMSGGRTGQDVALMAVKAAVEQVSLKVQVLPNS